MGKLMSKLITGVLLTLIIGVILYVNYYPHYNGLINTPENYSYSGQASWFDPWDINNYFATIKLAQKDQNILLSNINTTEKGKPAFIYPIYTLSAILFPNVNNILLYQILAIGCGTLLALGIFAVTNFLIKKPFHSLYALLIISIGGGLGFLFSAPEMSTDLYIPGVTFLSNFQKPHEAIAALLYISSLVFFFLAVEQQKIRLLLISIAAFVVLIPIYPYRLVSFFLITSIFVLVSSMRMQKKYPFTYLGIFSAFVFPPAIFYTFHFLNSSFSVLTSYQPHQITLLSLFLGYGFFIVFFVFQLFLTKNKTPLMWFLNIWIIVSISLSLLPFGLSRLFLSGLLFPMALIFVIQLINFSKHSHLFLIFIMIITLMMVLPTSIYTFNKRIAEAHNSNNIWFYIPQSYRESFEFLERSDQNGILALPSLSSYIPARTGKHVYFGIKDQSPDYDTKLVKAENFYSGTLSESEAKSFLQENNINLVVVSLQEKQFDALAYPFLTVVYKNKDIEILSR
ncbi:hypothetical protein COY16_01975 [Candidatus Roizmanbacteria bacterium CG_4_10_14_0_2_um_filter_39_13]|uniref:Glycosyltransferase RgtA/B/C/D-like domain-containing protein n=1 Tax=Candidatus Roizmanbacteria bacterium CG_4_10_14_0_2_um_filter_39_13 TaxID=1974825 RepID=A0A2M7U052_9BACT|nr:MAG: hypothetical protein COY16_01975 [Candidatus Roizmanbacteria bacterium CG_4_10_14_0_2_um_filter_39_13]